MSEIIHNLQDVKEIKSGLYIHVPYCRKKCIYCDFFSGGSALTDWHLFTRAIVNELRERRHELSAVPATLYIGGGTPSLMPPDAFRLLIGEICAILDKSDAWEEFTIEVNPEDVSPEKCELWRSCGVDRVSMGVQSLIDSELRLIGRGHDAATALEALAILQRYFSNVTVDLIFGLPGQSMDSWKYTVGEVIERCPAHVSAYSLMFEEGTALTVLREQGRLQFPPEEECVEMWRFLSETMKQRGYRQYELSNYSLPGYESRHNRRYWLGNPYLGLGPSAHSYDGNNIRRANPNDLRGFLKRFGTPELPEGNSTDFSRQDGQVNTPYYIEERLSEEELMEEKIMLSLRMAEGIDLLEFERKFGPKALRHLLEAAKREIDCGRLVRTATSLCLSPEGVMVADDVILNLCI